MGAIAYLHTILWRFAVEIEQIVFTLKIPKWKSALWENPDDALKYPPKKKLRVEYWTLHSLNCHSFNYIAKGEGLSDSDY